MIVNELIAALPADVADSLEYHGDSSAEFAGLAVKANGKWPESRCFFLVDEDWIVDDSWPLRWESPSFWATETAAHRLALAQSNGAACFVVAQRSWNPQIAAQLSDENCFLVDNSYSAYFAFTEAIKHAISTRVTAITGSMGKTTTTAMIAHALHSLGFRTFSTTRSQNVAVSAMRNLTHSERSEHAVLEVSQGACRVFEKHDFSLEADVAVVTAIAAAHLEEFSSLREIALAKSAVFHGSPPGGVAVICLDTPFSDLLISKAREAGRRTVTFGESPEADIRLLDYVPDTRMVTAQIDGEEFSFGLGMAGRHMAVNSLAIIGVLRAHGIVGWREGAASLKSLAPLRGRGEIVSIPLTEAGQEVRIIDDSYNANPSSIRAALEAFQSHGRPQRGRKVVLLGDMLELGEDSFSEHRRLADDLAGADLDAIVLIGPEMVALHDALKRRPISISHYMTVPELAERCSVAFKPGDLILAKASHGTGLYAWLRTLTAVNDSSSQKPRN